jgi:5-methylcytosine-specific restriction protein B
MFTQAELLYRAWKKEQPVKTVEDPELDWGQSRVWLIAPGRGAKYWKQFKEQEEINIGWDIGDASRFSNEDAVREEMRRKWDETKSYKNDGLAVYQFAHIMQVGDVVIAKKGNSTYLAYGVVVSDYRYEERPNDHPHIRSVMWIDDSGWEETEQDIVMKTLTDVTKYPPYIERLEKLFGVVFSEISEDFLAGGGGDDSSDGERDSVYGLDELLEEVFMDRAEATELLEVLNRKKNIILQGPPGTGKTFIAKRLAYASMGEKDKSRVETVQFHQSYSYEDFIQGYRPVTGGQFDRKDGVFLRFCERARKMPEKAFFFVIDEINRGNLSKIFGELMMLIEADKRGDGHRVQLTYSNQDEHFSIPSNVHIIGTMNTADRSLAMVDYALRRRFAFFEMPPRFGSRFKTQMKGDGCPTSFIDTIISRMNALNSAIESDSSLGRGFQVGHSYFIDSQDGSLWNSGGEKDMFASIIKHEVAPLLEEYWFDNEATAQEHIAKLNG